MWPVPCLRHKQPPPQQRRNHTPSSCSLLDSPPVALLTTVTPFFLSHSCAGLRIPYGGNIPVRRRQTRPDRAFFPLGWGEKGLPTRLWDESARSSQGPKTSAAAIHQGTPWRLAAALRAFGGLVVSRPCWRLPRPRGARRGAGFRRCPRPSTTPRGRSPSDRRAGDTRC